MIQNIESTLQSIARGCAEQLFADYGMALLGVENAREVDGRHEFFLCGVIGFTGKMLRGSVVLAVGREILAASAPPGQGSLRDWVAELSNQLLGRIKRQLLERGVTIQMCTPAVLRGERLSPLLGSETTPVLFSSAHGVVSVCIEAEALESVTLDVAVTEPLAAEGSVVLF